MNDLLTQASQSIPMQEAEELLAFVLGISVTHLRTKQDFKIDEKQQEQFWALVKRRKSHEPLHYILGSVTFDNDTYLVSPSVLIPRPETETLVDSIEEDFADDDLQNKLIVDIGTGSGCIALSLKKRFPQSQVVAIDVSQEALKVASQNAKQLNRTIDLREGSLFSPLLEEESPAIIVANLPYLSPDDGAISPTKEDLAYEPALALYAEDDGLALICELLLQVKEKTLMSTIYLELLPRQIPLLEKWILKQDLEMILKPLPDILGVERFVRIEIHHE